MTRRVWGATRTAEEDVERDTGARPSPAGGNDQGMSSRQPLRWVELAVWAWGRVDRVVAAGSRSPRSSQVCEVTKGRPRLDSLGAPPPATHGMTGAAGASSATRSHV